MEPTSEQPDRLHLLTFDSTTEPAQPDCAGSPSSTDHHDCDGYVCEHDLCTAEREHRVSRGIRRRPQPWDSARRAA